MLAASLPVLAFDEFDGSSTIAGLFFAAFGAGAVVGSILALKLVPKFDPIKLGAVALVGLTTPLPLLSLPIPAAAVIVVLFVGSIFGPLINAPLIGVLTMRTPEALRAKVMTAGLTMALLAGPVGLVVVGPLLQSWGPRPVLLLVAAGQFLATLPFARIAFRRPDEAPPVTLEAA
jgi:predicted MFS family arabinose efflux permease